MTRDIVAGPADLLPGTLELLILRTLALQKMHGYGIAQHVKRVSDEVLHLGEGSLYPALQRMQVKGWTKSKWGLSPTGRRVRYYELTASGRKQLAPEQAAFDRIVLAINKVMASE